MSTKPRVFISYARSDGLPFARRLRDWLDGKQIPLWHDLVNEVGGQDFLLQIFEAIDQVEFLLLLMTPNALKSEAVKKEWRHARQRGVCVFPVIVPELDVDIGSLPHWMSSVQWYNLNYEEQWTKLLNDLSTRCQTPRVPFMVDDLPPDFVPRPHEFDQLVALLRDEDREEPKAITAALPGAGGYGKTTLARALCHDEPIQEAFDDGILWVTLGENPGGLTEKIVDLIEVLSGERPGFKDEAPAIHSLKELLADRDILMVIDDVWNAAHLYPFLQGGPRCARLVTTRNLDTLPPAAQKVNVDAMRQSEAVALVGAGLSPGHENALRELATRLGEWPLLLRLANGALRSRVDDSKQPLPEALTFVNADLDENGLIAFDPENPEERHQAVAATLGVSLKLLGADRARYEELAIFPEDVDIPLATIERLWSSTGGLSKVKTEKLCQHLYRLSLLLSFDLATRTIRLHDVMRKYLGTKLKDAEAIHGQLVDAWGDPHRLPDDYAWRWLTYHLMNAGRAEQLQKLLLDFDWLQAKLEATDITALVADYDCGSGTGILPVESGTRILPVESGTRISRVRKHGQDAHATEGGATPSPNPEPLTPNPLVLVQGALRLSAHVLAQNKTELRGQLVGRLVAEEPPVIHSMLEQAKRSRGAPWLRPTTNSLTAPGGPLVRTLQGHTGSVTAVAVTPDGKLAISASYDQTLKVWEVGSGREVRTLQGHTGWVAAVAVTPDGKLAISASRDNTLKVWEVASGREVRTLEGHTAEVNAVAVTPEGKLAISASGDSTLKVWELASGREVRTLKGHADEVTAVAVTPDGKLAISASGDGTLKVWELASGREVRTLEGHTGAVTAVAVTSDGKQAISASGDDTLKVWEVASGREVRTLEGHTSHVNAVAVTPGGKLAISASGDCTLKVWEVASGRLIASLTVDGPVRACAVAPDGRTILAGDALGRVHFLHLEGV